MKVQVKIIIGLIFFIVVAGIIIFWPKKENIDQNSVQNANLNQNLNSNTNVNTNVNAVVNEASLDIDNDSLVDEQEKIYGTDPNRSDTDGDGYNDGLEVSTGHDPLKAAATNINHNQNVNVAQDLSINLSLSTDKTAYHSKENIILTVKLKSNQDVSGVLIKAEGIQGRSAKYFSQSQTVNLENNQENTLALTSTLPSCSACAGISPGDYTITTQVLSNNTIINQKSIAINLQQ